MHELTISLPFQIDAFGKVASTSDQRRIWADRVTMALGTVLTERVMRPGYGSAIAAALYESEDLAITKVESEVARVFAERLPLLSLADVNVLGTAATDGTVTVEVVYALPNGDEVTTAVGVAATIADAPLYEESL